MSVGERDNRRTWKHATASGGFQRTIRNSPYATSHFGQDVYKRQLNEIREKWSEGIPILKDKRFDEVVTQYSCFSHEMGIAALGPVSYTHLFKRVR